MCDLLVFRPVKFTGYYRLICLLYFIIMRAFLLTNKKNAAVFALLWVSLLAGGEARAQQNNLQLLVPPAADLARAKTRDIAAAYTDTRGGRVDLNGLDVSVFYGERRSSGTYDSAVFGAALVGTPGNETIRLGGVRRDVVGMALHGGPARYYLYGGGELPRGALFVSMPVSFGNYSIIKGSKEEGKFYNFLAGAQGGALLNLKAGDFLAAPMGMVSLMGGYVEKYKGGTYLANMSSGGVRPFAVLTLGTELAYLPVQARLRAFYQRAYGNGRERAMDSLTFQFLLGWGAVHKKPAGAAAGL